MITDDSDRPVDVGGGVQQAEIDASESAEDILRTVAKALGLEHLTQEYESSKQP